MKIIIFFLLLLFLSSFHGCEYEVWEEGKVLEIENNFVSQIDIYVADSDTLYMYPNTILPKNYDELYHSIFPGSSTMCYGNLLWQSWFSFYNTDTLCIYILSTDTVKKYNWEKIREDYNILVRYDLSLSDLLNLKRKIPYPPTEKMKDMKMYLPYKSSILLNIKQ